MVKTERQHLADLARLLEKMRQRAKDEALLATAGYQQGYHRGQAVAYATVGSVVETIREELEK